MWLLCVQVHHETYDSEMELPGGSLRRREAGSGGAGKEAGSGRRRERITSPFARGSSSVERLVER